MNISNDNGTAPLSEWRLVSAPRLEPARDSDEQAAREKCAALCDSIAARYTAAANSMPPILVNIVISEAMASEAAQCAKAIRGEGA